MFVRVTTTSHPQRRASTYSAYREETQENAQKRRKSTVIPCRDDSPDKHQRRKSSLPRFFHSRRPSAAAFLSGLIEKIDEDDSKIKDRDEDSTDSKIESRPLTLCTETSYVPLPPRICIMVRGTLFQTFEATLDVYPETLLGNKSSREKYFNKETNTYTFDRCPLSFDNILFYYQSPGILSQPLNVRRCHFLEELEFFQITEYLDQRHKLETDFLEQLRREEDMPSKRKLQFIRRFLGLRYNSRMEMFLYLLYLSVIGASILNICFETLTEFRHLKKVWFYLDIGFCFLFTLEYFLHLFVAKNARAYIISFTGLMDLIAVLPTQCFLALHLLNVPDELINFFDFLRMSRLIKCFQTSRGLRQVIVVLFECKEYILLLVVSIFQSCIIFSSLVFHVEDANGISLFPTFLDALWYTIITATGVGYGDSYPKTVAGKIFGSWLSVLGVLLFCLPTSKLVYKFVECFYLPYILTTDRWGEKRRRTATHIRNKFLESMDCYAQ